ncbi:MAG: hypothetical protein ACFNYM_08740 [Bacteroidota bacterium]|jgi:hypothetical protein
MKRNRHDRNKDFDTFYDKSEGIFKNLQQSDKRTEKFEREHMLYVCPGSRNGGTDKRIVEVFLGSKVFEIETQGRYFKSLMEQGSTLFFYRNDTGHVTISLYPAYTDFRKPIEDSITLHSWLDPLKLRNKIFLKSLWQDFIAYMECTCLDGMPSWRQRIRIEYLRFTKHLVINKEWKPTRLNCFLYDIIKFVLTVGLSGFIIYFVTKYSS